MSISKLFHLKGIKYYFFTWLINHLYAGTKEKNFEKKRKLLNRIGYEIGEGTKVVGPIYCTGKLIVGKNCWLGKNLCVHGNGVVTVGDNCDIAPEVSFLTGGHKIGDSARRAGEGIIVNINVGNGVWIGARSTILNDIGDSCVVAACACVNKKIDDNLLVGGVPARKIRDL